LPYAWPWTHCISQFKFHGEPGLAAPLASLLRSAPGAAQAWANADLVIPLPLSDERLAERGYNPAQLLAEHAAPPSLPVRLDLLLRTRHTLPQHDLPRAERLRNVRGAYAVEPLRVAALKGRRVLLVDDVMTTGASLHEAARAVRSAGAAHITTLALARTPAH
jgi:ComF family protein